MQSYITLLITGLIWQSVFCTTIFASQPCSVKVISTSVYVTLLSNAELHPRKQCDICKMLTIVQIILINQSSPMVISPQFNGSQTRNSFHLQGHFSRVLTAAYMAAAMMTFLMSQSGVCSGG